MKPIESLPWHEIFCFKDVDKLRRVSTRMMYTKVQCTSVVYSFAVQDFIWGHQIDELLVMQIDGIEIRGWLFVDCRSLVFLVAIMFVSYMCELVDRL